MNHDIYFKPPEIKTYVIKRKWWLDKVEYWIEWEFVRIGPFKSYKDALEIMKIYDATKL